MNPIFFDYRQVPTTSSICIDCEDYSEGDDEDYGDDSDDNEELESQSSQIRLQLVLLEYKQFKAARAIQALYRGWSCRQEIQNKVAAANKIIRFWRGYRARNKFYEMVESKLQNTLIALYNRKANRIQSLFKGWHTRQYVHDVSGLHLMQLHAMEDLISSLACNLHEMREQGYLPGVYSLRKSDLYAHLDHLLMTLLFRLNNGRVRAIIDQRTHCLSTFRKQFAASRFNTVAPYMGPNVLGLCKEKYDYDFSYGTKLSAEMDVRLLRIYADYEETRRETRAHKVQKLVAEKKTQKLKHTFEAKEVHSRKMFCLSVMERLNQLFSAGERKKMFYNLDQVLDDLQSLREL